MIKLLSYTLTKTVPVYGHGAKEIDLHVVKSVEKGDSCRTYRIGFENHWGTHVDCPAHFFESGRGICEYESDSWLFKNPQIMPIKAAASQIIGIDDLQGVDPQTDLLLLRSGFGKYREEDVYCLKGPGIAPSVGVWLREEFPILRAVGIDWISISSYAHRDLGREAHRTFLRPDGKGSPLLLIEDMFFPDDMDNLKQVLVAPIRVEGIDSSPCTVLGFFE